MQNGDESLQYREAFSCNSKQIEIASEGFIHTCASPMMSAALTDAVIPLAKCVVIIRRPYGQLAYSREQRSKKRVVKLETPRYSSSVASKRWATQPVPRNLAQELLFAVALVPIAIPLTSVSLSSASVTALIVKERQNWWHLYPREKIKMLGELCQVSF